MHLMLLWQPTDCVGPNLGILSMALLNSVRFLGTHIIVGAVVGAVELQASMRCSCHAPFPQQSTINVIPMRCAFKHLRVNSFRRHMQIGTSVNAMLETIHAKLRGVDLSGGRSRSQWNANRWENSISMFQSEEKYAGKVTNININNKYILL